MTPCASLSPSLPTPFLSTVEPAILRARKQLPDHIKAESPPQSLWLTLGHDEGMGEERLY